MLSRKPVLLLLGIISLAVLSAGCLKTESSDSPASKSSALTPAFKLNIAAPSAPVRDEFLTYVGGKPILPKWKTNWERNIERLYQNAKALGKSYADQYDDYRNLNFDKFYITKAPVTPVRVVAEFEPSQAALVAWDLGLGTAVDTFYQDMIKAIWGTVPLIMVYENATQKSFIEGKLTAAGIPAGDLTDPTKVVWWQHAMDAIWSRDFGPVGIVNASGTATVSFVDFRYYHTRIHDDEIPTDLAKAWGINVFRPDLDFEGGNLMNTSDGLCAATKGVLWFNLQFAQSAVEDIFKTYLGCKKNIFPTPLQNEGTTHIDMFSKYGTDTTVMVGQYSASSSNALEKANAPILDANAALYASTTNGSGGTVAVTRIPMPKIGGTASNPTWRTYTNSQALSNGTTKIIAIPVYSDETTTEAAAMTAYSTVFPGWTQKKVDSKAIIPWGGAIHCVLMQVPAGAKAKMEADPTDLCGPKAIACKVASCGNIKAEGCCDGDVLRYCDNGKPAMVDCAGNPKCGWDTGNDWYDCGTAGAADPSNTHPINCGVLTDAAVPDMGPDQPKPNNCGALTYEGCCDGETVWFCDDGNLASINCSQSPKCGWSTQGNYYDCGTAGTADPGGAFPLSCTGLFGDGGPPPSDGIKIPDQNTTTGCGAITEEGCCDGEVLKYCMGSQLATIDCTGEGNPKCGWDSSSSWYDCGTSGGADPSGTFPKTCATAQPDGSVKKDMSVKKDQMSPDKPNVVIQDSSQSQDQATLSDAPLAKLDGAKKKDAGDDKEDGGGCSCAVSERSSSGGWMMLLLGLGLFLRRRRR